MTEREWKTRMRTAQHMVRMCEKKVLDAAENLGALMVRATEAKPGELLPSSTEWAMARTAMDVAAELLARKRARLLKLRRGDS